MPPRKPTSLIQPCVQRLLENLELFEELDDALVGVTLVLDDLACLALLGGRHVGDLLTGAAPADRVCGHTQVCDLDLVDRLILVRHYPLEGGIASLDDTGRHP